MNSLKPEIIELYKQREQHQTWLLSHGARVEEINRWAGLCWQFLVVIILVSPCQVVGPVQPGDASQRGEVLADAGHWPGPGSGVVAEQGTWNFSHPLVIQEQTTRPLHQVWQWGRPLLDLQVSYLRSDPLRLYKALQSPIFYQGKPRLRLCWALQCVFLPDGVGAPLRQQQSGGAQWKTQDNPQVPGGRLLATREFSVHPSRRHVRCDSWLLTSLSCVISDQIYIFLSSQSDYCAVSRLYINFM